jgi:hypothetical protein
MRIVALIIAAAVVTVSGTTTDHVARDACFDLASGTVVCPPIRAVVGDCVELLSGTLAC